MRKLTKGRLTSILVYALAAAIVLPGLAFHATVARAGAQTKVIVLPLANNTEVGGAELAERVERALRLALEASGRASVLSVRPSAPAVRRAMDIEKTLEPSDLDLQPPIKQDQAQRLGRALSADVVLWGTIDEFTYDQHAGQVTVGLSVSKLSVTSGQVSVVAVSGKSVTRVGFAGGQGPLMTEAIDNAVSKVMEGVVGVGAKPPTTAPTAPTPAVREKKDKTWQTLGIIAAVAAVAALAGGGGGEAAPPGPVSRVVSDAVATPTEDSVVLSWTVATGAAGITGFNIYRAEMGSLSGAGKAARPGRAPHSRVRPTRTSGGYYPLVTGLGSGRAFPSNVPADARTYTDRSALAGTLYAYAITAVVGGAETPQVDFLNYYEATTVVGPDYPRPPALLSYALGLDSVDLSWTPNPESFVTAYRVYRSTVPTGPWNSTTLLAGVPASQTSYADPAAGLEIGRTYYYALGAVTGVTAPDGRIGPARDVPFELGQAPNVNLVVEPSVIPAAGAGSTALLTATVKHPSGMSVPDGAIVRFAFISGDTISDSGARISADRQRVLTRDGIAYSTLISPASVELRDYDLVRAWVDADDDGVFQVSEATALILVFYTPPPSYILLAADPTSVPADGRSVSKVVATVFTGEPDPTGHFDQPVADGTPVRLTTTMGKFASSGTSTATLRVAASIVSDYLISPTTTGVANVTATSVLVSASVQITFTSRELTQIMVAADPATLQANGTDTADILIRVYDDKGKPKPGVALTLYSDLGKLTDARLVTNTDGEAATVFTAGLIAGTATVLVKTGGVSAIVTITLTSGPPAHLSLTWQSPNETLAATNGLPSISGASPTGTVYARVTDKYGNPVRDGTPVLFHTDIGQITSSALTADGTAEATLTSCSFIQATQNATARPGRATVTAHVDNPAGSPVSSPEPFYITFSGDASFATWDGTYNGTGFTDYLIGFDYGRPFYESVEVSVGDKLSLWYDLFDLNGNPLPGGVDLTWKIKAGGDTIAEGSAGTTSEIDIVFGAVGCYVKLEDLEIPEKIDAFEGKPLTGTLEIKTPVIVRTFLEDVLDIIVSPKGPKAIELKSLAGAAITPPTAGPSGPYYIQADVVDKYGNVVLDDTPVYFTVMQATNVVAHFAESPVPTSGGRAFGELMIDRIIDRAVAGSIIISVGSPGLPPTSDALAQITVTINIPSGP